MARTKSPNFEASLAQLEELITQLESGDLSLEDSLKTFEQGIKLTRSCQKSLAEAEQKVEVLLKQDDGELTTAPFPSDDEN